MRNDGELRGECAFCESAVTPDGFDGWPDMLAR